MTKPQTTFDRMMKNPDFKKAFAKEYHEFLFSELLLAVMDSDAISVRRLAEEAGISPSVIQDIRSGKQEDIRLSNLIKIAGVFGFQVVLKRDDEQLVLNTSKRDKKLYITPQLG